MRRFLCLLLALPVVLSVAGGSPALAAGAAYHPVITGAVKQFGLAGVEPDGDPLYQVVLQARLAPSAGEPAVNLIVSSYLENFRPDTTPILPDLLHPNQNARNLGGFLQGKALLTDDAGNVLYIGSFLAEAFLDNTNHAVMRLYGSGTSYGGSGALKGMFALDHKGTLTGRFTGRVTLSPAARRQITRNRGARMKPLKQIISVVTVTPHYYGTRGVKGTGQVLNTGYGHGASPAPVSSVGRHISPWTLLAGAGAIISLLLAGILYWMERHRSAQVRPTP